LPESPESPDPFETTRETARLTIRRATEVDRSDVVGILHCEVATELLLADQFPPSAEAAQAYFEIVAAVPPGADRDPIIDRVLVLHERRSRRFRGVVRLRRLKHKGGAWDWDVVWILSPTGRGRELAFEALREVLSQFARRGDVRSFRAKIASCNASALALARRLGMTVYREGQETHLGTLAEHRGMGKSIAPGLSLLADDVTHLHVFADEVRRRFPLIVTDE